MRTWLNKIMLVGVAAITFSSCEKDEVRTVLTTGTAPTLQSSVTSLVLLQANANNNAVKFTYTTDASFGFDAAVTYVLQIAKGGTSFANASTTEVGLSKTAPLEKTFKVVDFNRELLKIITPGAATPVEVRVKATVAAAAPAIYSNVVTITATAYRDLIVYSYPDALNIAGNFQGWSPGTAPQIVNKNNGGYTNATNNRYEGYIVFNDPSPQFKMVRGNDWVGDFGSNGGNNLREGGPNLTLPSGGAGVAGYWRIRADLSAPPAPGQWYWDKINTWGIIGEFNGWSASDPMTFNASTGVWTITRDMPVGNEVESFPSALAFLQRGQPEVPACLVTDLRMPGMNGLGFQHELIAAGWRIPIIFVTGHGDVPASVRAMKAGAIEFFTKPFQAQEFLSAISAALSRDRASREQQMALATIRRCYESLTPRECEVMSGVVAGMSNKRIAATLNITEKTVKFHRAHIMEKMMALSLAALVQMAIKLSVRPDA